MVVTWPRELLNSGMNDNAIGAAFVAAGRGDGGKVAGEKISVERKVNVSEIVLKNCLDKD